MGELRAAAVRTQSPADQAEEARREAHMRQNAAGSATRQQPADRGRLRRLARPGIDRAAPPATQDQRVLRGLPKRKITMTWVPWTHSRLAFRSGYGAGVESPGWYHHLFTAADAVIERWLTRVAGPACARRLPVSSAHVIEAVRLADTLATLRGQAHDGSGRAAGGHAGGHVRGRPALLRVVTRDAVVGEELGTVPDEAPSVPLEADLKATARTVRLPIKPDEKAYTLDLRKDIDRGKSKLLRRLAVLGIPWGDPRRVSGTGTFKEGWVVVWQPESSR